MASMKKVYNDLIIINLYQTSLNSFSLKKVLIQSKNSFFRGQKQQEKKLD